MGWLFQKCNTQQSVVMAFLVSHQGVANSDQYGQKDYKGDFQLRRHCFLEIFPLSMQLYRPFLMVTMSMLVSMSLLGSMSCMSVSGMAHH